MMETDKVAFNLRLADVFWHIQCLYRQTSLRCKDFWEDSKGNAQRKICITHEDIEAERQLLLGKKEPSELLNASTPDMLEYLTLCRKIARQLPGMDRVLFHGSALSMDGMGILFAAKSGIGKSTHSRLWREAFGQRVRMINDDKPFLSIGEKQITVYGTPWRGKHGLGSAESAPLKAICFLQRCQENRIEPMELRDAFPMMLQQTFLPEDPKMMLHTMDLIRRMSETVPCYCLHCNMEMDAAHVAYQGLEESLRKKAGVE